MSRSRWSNRHTRWRLFPNVAFVGSAVGDGQLWPTPCLAGGPLGGDIEGANMYGQTSIISTRCFRWTCPRSGRHRGNESNTRWRLFPHAVFCGYVFGGAALARSLPCWEPATSRHRRRHPLVSGDRMSEFFIAREVVQSIFVSSGCPHPMYRSAFFFSGFWVGAQHVGKMKAPFGGANEGLGAGLVVPSASEGRPSERVCDDKESCVFLKKMAVAIQ